MESRKGEDQLEWLKHSDLRQLLASDGIPTPWFSAYKSIDADDQHTTWFSALVPPGQVSSLLAHDSGWDVHIGDGGPAIFSYSEGDSERFVYTPYGNDSGIEPLVLHRHFHDIRPDSLELAQEFRLYHNLYLEPSKNRYIAIDNNGDESDAARFGPGFMEVRTDLLVNFCAAKQVSLAIYIDSARYAIQPLAELGSEEIRESDHGPYHCADAVVVSESFPFKEKYSTLGRLLGKKYVAPRAMPRDNEPEEGRFQEFIIGTDESGNLIRHSCNPEHLGNYFGKNPDAPHYLTPVYFRPEVLAKYYAEPAKYTVEDGGLRCGGLWHLRMDNDHSDYIVVWLGDLGQDLHQQERDYWLSFNISPAGRKISRTNFKRAFLAEFADPSRPDLVFKSNYADFCVSFKSLMGWDFFLPLHPDDEHLLTALHLPMKDNQAEFDSQLIALTKIIVDSLNEKAISKDVATIAKDDKSITKLEKFFSSIGASGYEGHIEFLRVLQNLRSVGAAHRKGSNYDKVVADLQLKDEGHQLVFGKLLNAANEFIQYLQKLFLPEENEV